jgi:hypothetical protein
MKLTLILLVVIVCSSAVLGCDKRCEAKKAKRAQEKALVKACKELGGGTKIKLEIDLGGACHPPCKNQQKKKKAKKVIVDPIPSTTAPPAPEPLPIDPPQPAGGAGGKGGGSNTIVAY